VDGADGSGGCGRLLGRRGGADARGDVVKGKREGGDGRKKGDAGGDVMWAPPGGDPARAR
jgi:hypothetical protein